MSPKPNASPSAIFLRLRPLRQWPLKKTTIAVTVQDLVTAAKTRHWPITYDVAPNVRFGWIVLKNPAFRKRAGWSPVGRQNYPKLSQKHPIEGAEGRRSEKELLRFRRLRCSES